MAKSDMPNVLGVDLGGTKLLFAAVDGDGRIISRAKVESATTSSEEIIAQIVTGIESMREKLDDSVSAVGIGVPGTVDMETGHVVATANLPLSDVDLGRKLTEACGLPVVVGNDVTLCTLGEAWYGAGRGVKHIFGVFIGTGIGGGIIIDGNPYTGAHGAAGEVGHMQMVENGPRCGCGRDGCFEALASRTAIERDIRAAVEAGRECTLAEAIRSGERIRSGLLRKALKEEDPLVTEVMLRAAEVMGAGVANVVNLVDPDMVVLGGGVMEACAEFLMPTILRTAEAQMMAVPGGPIPILSSQLGDDAGVMGAAAMAQESLKVRRPGGPTAYVPQIEWIAEGEVQINGERYVADVVVRADGNIKKRRRKLSRRVHGNAHLVSAEEARFICKGRPQSLIVGTGTQQRLSIGEDARMWIEQQEIKLLCFPSPQAVTEYRALRGARALLLHLRD